MEIFYRNKMLPHVQFTCIETLMMFVWICRSYNHTHVHTVIEKAKLNKFCGFFSFSIIYFYIHFVNESWMAEKVFVNEPFFSVEFIDYLVLVI